MLRTLRIRDLVTIDDLTVEFGPGLNVLTGETGAGKSIVVDALGLAAGDRADTALVRTGCERAVIEASFEAPLPAAVRELLVTRGLDPPEDGLLVVRREVGAGGANRVFVNGSPATVALLREVGDALVELHGQHEHQSLLTAERHLEILDAFGGHRTERDGVAAAFREVEGLAARLADLRSRGRERAARAEALRAAIRDIDAVAPRPGETDALERERRILQSAERVARLLDEAVTLLYEGDPSAVSLVAAGARRAADLAVIDPELADLAARLDVARVEIQDAGTTLRDYRDGRDFDPARLEAIESRRAALARLLLRFGPDEEGALAAREEASAELLGLAGIDEATAATERALADAIAAYRVAASRLGQTRREAAGRLARAIEAELAELALAKARFEVALTPARGVEGLGADGDLPISPRGAERAEFLLAANPGDPPRPLARVASGGELSRTMLAVHAVLEAGSGPATLVFDEVDAGVGGAVASSVGARLARIGACHQVLCVTHLPQVAAHADSHYHVRKRLAGGRATTGVARLDADARLDELARMLGGIQPSDAARQNAADLLAEAGASTTRRSRKGR